MLHTSDCLLIIKVVLSLRLERDLGSVLFCTGALKWTLLPFHFLAQINTYYCSISFTKRVSLSHLVPPKTALVDSNAILHMELSEALLSSSCSHMMRALRWPQGRRAGDKVQELHLDAKFNSYIKKKDDNLGVTLWGTSVVTLNEPHGRSPRKGSGRREKAMEGVGIREEVVTPPDK